MQGLTLLLRRHAPHQAFPGWTTIHICFGIVVKIPFTEPPLCLGTRGLRFGYKNAPDEPAPGRACISPGEDSF